jgi:hypothetical protein
MPFRAHKNPGPRLRPGFLAFAFFRVRDSVVVAGAVAFFVGRFGLGVFDAVPLLFGQWYPSFCGPDCR